MNGPATDYQTQIYERYATSMSSAGDDSGRLPYFRRLAKFLPDPAASVLELGAGSGGFLLHLAQAGFADLRGVDASPEQVAIAQGRGAPVRQGDAMATLCQTENSAYGVVIALDVVEHFSKAEAFALLTEIHRVLTPGGRCVIHTVNADSPFFGTIRYGDFTHETAFNRGSMTQVLHTIGFAEVCCYEDRPIIHGLRSLARATIWALARGVATVVLAAETGTLGGRILTQNFFTVATK